MDYEQPPCSARACRESRVIARGLAVLVASFGAACSSPADPVQVDAPPAETTALKLARYLTGEFDSIAQSQQTPSYYGVKLTMCAVEAPEIADTVLYVEQALMDTLDQPYRQRLYAILPVDGEPARAVSQVWQFHAPDDVIHLCDDRDRPILAAGDVFGRRGCDVHMAWNDDHFAGGTHEQECESSLRGATYATSEIEITPMLLTSWDRGYDADGNQVWGAVDGPYRFERRTPMPAD